MQWPPSILIIFDSRLALRRKSFMGRDVSVVLCPVVDFRPTFLPARTSERTFEILPSVSLRALIFLTVLIGLFSTPLKILAFDFVLAFFFTNCTTPPAPGTVTEGLAGRGILGVKGGRAGLGVAPRVTLCPAVSFGCSTRVCVRACTGGACRGGMPHARGAPAGLPCETVEGVCGCLKGLTGARRVGRDTWS